MSSNDDAVLTIPPGFASREVASFMAQLDELRSRVVSDLNTMPPEEIGWQPAPGANTIGMLLAHLAIVEVHWFAFGIEGQTPADIEGNLGIGMDDDGMPVPEGGLPPAGLTGKGPAYFVDLLARSRDYARRVATPLTDADVDRVVELKKRKGGTFPANARWIIYHVLEHEAGHWGQILLLRHLYRIRPGTDA